MNTPSAPCSSLVGDELRADVPGVEPPPANAVAADVWIGFDGQTGRLDQANANRRAVLHTIEACERRDRQIADRLSAPWWRRPFLPNPN